MWLHSKRGQTRGKNEASKEKAGNEVKRWIAFSLKVSLLSMLLMV